MLVSEIGDGNGDGFFRDNGIRRKGISTSKVQPALINKLISRKTI